MSSQHHHQRPRELQPVSLDAAVHEWPAASMAAVVAQLGELRSELRDHVEKEEAQWARWDGAFPDGDASAHRRAHESMIRAASAEERFWSELRLDIAKKGLWGLLIIVLGLAAAGFYSQFGGPRP